MSRAPFIIDVSGRFTPATMRILWREEARPSDPRIEAMIAETWERQRRACEQRNAMLFNGAMARCIRYEVEAGRLSIEVGPTDYREFLGTNFLNYDQGDALGWERYANPVGTSSTVITRDGWLLYGRRGQRVATYPGYLHTFGGSLEARDRRANGTVDGFDSIRRELEEELGIEAGEIEEVVCVGLVRDGGTRQPELIFDARVGLSRGQIVERYVSGRPDEEHTAIEACRDGPEAMAVFAGAAGPITPIAVAALHLHAAQDAG